MKLFILISLVLLTSCMAQRVSIVFEVYSPYCAGAKPTPEMAIGITKAFSNEKIAVFRKEPNKNSVLVKWIELDSSGKWIGPLKPGTNYTWNISYQRNVSKNLQLSIQYLGRKSENSRLIQSGTMEVRAFF